MAEAFPTRSIEYDDTSRALRVIDQTRLPRQAVVVSLHTLDEVCDAIRRMVVRGAPLIGACAAFGMAFALREDASAASEERAAAALLATRPTAVNIRWAVERVRRAIASGAAGAIVGAGRASAEVALAEANAIVAEDIAACSAIGDHGLEIVRSLVRERAAHRASDPTAAGPLRVLTHCNAGWLATCAWGTALAPVYKAHAAGIPVQVWVDETRPRSQGASLTAWELGAAGVPHTLIADTAAAHVMQRGLVDVVFVGSDRTTSTGDVCNKIGTYGVALAARESGVPFYACVPTSSIDWSAEDGIAEIPIEERASEEVLREGLAPAGTSTFNPAFDVTPARFVTGIVTEHGTFAATRQDLARLRAHLESAETASDVR